MPLVVTRDGARTTCCFGFATRELLLRGAAGAGCWGGKRGARLGDAVVSRDLDRFLRGAAGGVVGAAGAVCWGGVRAGLREAALVLRGAGGGEGRAGAIWRGGVLGPGRLDGALRGVPGRLGVWRFGGVWGVRGEEGERSGEGFGFFGGVSGLSSSSSLSSSSFDEGEEDEESDEEDSLPRSTKSTFFFGDLGDGVSPVRSTTLLFSADRLRLRPLEAAAAPFL